MKYMQVPVAEYDIKLKRLKRSIGRKSKRYAAWIFASPGETWEFSPTVLDGNTMEIRMDPNGNRVIRIVPGRKKQRGTP